MIYSTATTSSCLEGNREPLSHILSHPRFGTSLARVRTRHTKAVKKAARSFLREAAATMNEMDKRPQVNGHWIRHARLSSVLDYLAAPHLKM